MNCVQTCEFRRANVTGRLQLLMSCGITQDGVRLPERAAPCRIYRLEPVYGISAYVYGDALPTAIQH